MSHTRRRMLALCLPPLLFAFLDVSLTLYGQPKEYWAGDYTQVREMSGTIRGLLQISPMAVLGGVALLVVLFVAIIYLLPDTLALIMAIAQTTASCNGASTWLLWHHPYGYQITNLIHILAAAMLGVSIRFVWQARPPQNFQPSIPAIWRWPLLVALLSIALYVGFRT